MSIMYPYQSPYSMNKQFTFFEKNYPPDCYWNVSNGHIGPYPHGFHKPAYLNSQHFYNNSNSNEKTSTETMPVASDYSIRSERTGGLAKDAQDHQSQSQESQDNKNNQIKHHTASSSSSVPSSALSFEPSSLKPSMAAMPPFVGPERPFKCTLCPKSFNQRINLNNHIRTHTGEKPYTCSICFKTFSQRTTLKNHQRTHTGEKPYPCLECGKAFAQRTNLKNHERVHSGEKPFKCPVCGKAFSQVTNLRNHEWTHSGQKPFACSMCPKTFCQPTDLRNHERVHTGEKPFTCATCLKTFSERTNLKIHQRTHTGEKPFQCVMCSKSFTQQTNLRNHERIHTGEKPFKCLLCSKAFSQVTNLRNHERTHSGDKPYKCLECHKAFSNKTNLKNHMRTHTGEKPFECTICCKAFSQQTNLENHIRTHSIAEVEAMAEQGRVYPKTPDNIPLTSTLVMRNKKQMFPQRLSICGTSVNSEYETSMADKIQDESENEAGLDEKNEEADRDFESRVMALSLAKQSSSALISKAFQSHMSQRQELANSKTSSTHFSGANFSLQELQQEFHSFAPSSSLRYPHVPPTLINPLYLPQMSQSWENYNLSRNFPVASKLGISEEGKNTASGSKEESNDSENRDSNNGSESESLQEGRQRKQKEPSQQMSSDDTSKEKQNTESNTMKDVLASTD